MTFTAKGNLNTHVLSVHEKRLDFACEHCGKMWPTLNTLKNHVRKTHAEHVNCDICDKKISNPLELRRHKVFVQKETKGAWLCAECPKSAFFSKSTFDKHMKSKH
jgi:NAD-dependent SIR2 family protein deacetylase